MLSRSSTAVDQAERCICAHGALLFAARRAASAGCHSGPAQGSVRFDTARGYSGARIAFWRVAGRSCFVARLARGVSTPRRFELRSKEWLGRVDREHAVDLALDVCGRWGDKSACRRVHRRKARLTDGEVRRKPRDVNRVLVP